MWYRLMKYKKRASGTGYFARFPSRRRYLWATIGAVPFMLSEEEPSMKSPGEPDLGRPTPASGSDRDL